MGNLFAVGYDQELESGQYRSRVSIAYRFALIMNRKPPVTRLKDIPAQVSGVYLDPTIECHGGGRH